MDKTLLLQAAETLLQGDIISAQEYTKLIIKIKTSAESDVCQCAIPTADTDNECCIICGKLLYSE